MKSIFLGKKNIFLPEYGVILKRELLISGRSGDIHV